jgi:hypothetical protein
MPKMLCYSFYTKLESLLFLFSDLAEDLCLNNKRLEKQNNIPAIVLNSSDHFNFIAGLQSLLSIYKELLRYSYELKLIEFNGQSSKFNGYSSRSKYRNKEVLKSWLVEELIYDKLREIVKKSIN